MAKHVEKHLYSFLGSGGPIKRDIYVKSVQSLYGVQGKQKSTAQGDDYDTLNPKKKSLKITRFPCMIWHKACGSKIFQPTYDTIFLRFIQEICLFNNPLRWRQQQQKQQQHQHKRQHVKLISVFCSGNVERCVGLISRLKFTLTWLGPGSAFYEWKLLWYT